MSKDPRTSLEIDLWTVSCQVRALGELIMFSDGREDALDEDEILWGLGYSIRRLGEEIQAIHSKYAEESLTIKPNRTGLKPTKKTAVRSKAKRRQKK